MAEESNTNQNTNPETGQTNETFESWLGTQDETVKSLISGHTQGLSNTVKAVRQERDDLAKQIKALSAKVEAGSDTQKELERMTAELEAANRRNDFFEGAAANGCNNFKAAFALASSENLFKKNGSPDWEAIKQEAPQLFEQKKTQPAFSGNGAKGSGGNTGASEIDDFIRRQFRG